jgi:formylglycine-generating enzyme required for sulfatase activity
MGDQLARTILVALALCGACSHRAAPVVSDFREEGLVDRGRDLPRDTPGPTPGWNGIPPGEFLMGSPPGEPCRERGGVKETQHVVKLTRRYEVQSKEVTQGEFNARMGYNPAARTVCGASCPVERASWSEAAAYCNALSQSAGLPLCYACTGSYQNVVCSIGPAFTEGKIYSCKGYRLPTEAEWERAYRGGTMLALYNGGIVDCTADAGAAEIGWYQKNSGGTIHPVGQKKVNPYGLYDMAGNVWEWCHDFYQQDLGSASVVDPWGKASESTRVLRGGSFFDPAADLRAAGRFGYNPATRNENIGFRCARTM